MGEEEINLAFKWILLIVLSAGAVWLAHDGKDGWGWLIFAVIMLA